MGPWLASSHFRASAQASPTSLGDFPLFIKINQEGGKASWRKMCLDCDKVQE